VRERRATPASNQEIADECVLSIDGVKSHLKELYNRFGMDDVPQNDKRSELARRALETGVVTEREVAAD
jgi:DNA-binding NarL/FixJ family response regulator